VRRPSGKSLALALGICFVGWGLAGCATHPHETDFTAISTQLVTIRWQQGAQAITGKVVFSRDAQGAVQMQWNRSQESPALRLLLTPDGRLTASGSLTDHPWTGPMDRAPQSLSSWANFLTTYQQAADLTPGFREIHSPAHRIAYEKTPLDLQSLSVASADIHESIAAIFLPTLTPDPDSSQPEKSSAR